MADDERSGPRSITGLTGEWDEDLGGWQFKGVVPGPAGLATVELPNGVTVDIDVTEPNKTVGVWVPDVEDVDRAHQAVALALANPDAIGRLALALDVLNGAIQPTEAARALAEVDRALATVRLDHHFAPRDVAALLQTAVDGVHAHADELLEADRPGMIADGLGFLLRRTGDHALEALIRVLDDASGPYDRSGEMADRSYPSPAADAPIPAEFRDRAARTAPVGRLLNIVDLATLPGGVRTDQVAARATTPSEIEVRLRVAPRAGWWVRAHRGEVVVAASPLRTAGEDGAVARLLVPPADLHYVEVDITEEPGHHRVSRVMRATLGGVRDGRAAARAERALNGREAEAKWMRCAQSWERAGDKRRATAALERSRLSGQPSGQPLLRTRGTLRSGPLLSDLTPE